MTHKLDLPPSEAGICLVLGLMAGCFTGPINQRPMVVSIAPTSVPVMRNEPAQFVVAALDADGDPLLVSWAFVPMECPSDPDPNHWSGDRTELVAGALQFTLPPERTGAPFCVCAFAIDSHHAFDAKCVAVTPTNRAPVAHIQVGTNPIVVPVGSLYPLYTTFDLSTDGSSDPEGDALTYSWPVFEPPPGSLAARRPCDDGVARELCFFADVPGPYNVSLTARDALGAESTYPVTISVADDQLPCIGGATPNYLNPTAMPPDPTRDFVFTINDVVDDGDPYPEGPNGRIHFTWYLGHGDLPLVYQGNDFPSFTLVPPTFDIGDTGRVRVEIRDRNVDAIDKVLRGCGDSAFCAAKPGCFQRVTWNVVYQ